MHASVMEWVASRVAGMGLANRDTIEIGSYNVNGGVRELFTGRYVGIDIRDGPGVDLVANGSALPFPDGSFDVAVCTETLEHDERPWLTVKEMSRVLRWGGVAIVSARGFGFPKHDFPRDCWRLSVPALLVLFSDAELAPLEVFDDPDPDNPGVLGIARK